MHIHANDWIYQKKTEKDSVNDIYYYGTKLIIIKIMCSLSSSLTGRYMMNVLEGTTHYLANFE